MVLVRQALAILVEHEARPKGLWLMMFEETIHVPYQKLKLLSGVANAGERSTRVAAKGHRASLAWVPSRVSRFHLVVDVEELLHQELQDVEGELFLGQGLLEEGFQGQLVHLLHVDIHRSVLSLFSHSSYS